MARSANVARYVSLVAVVVCTLFCMTSVTSAQSLKADNLLARLEMSSGLQGTMPASSGSQVDSLRVRLDKGPRTVTLLLDHPITSLGSRPGDEVEFRVGYPVSSSGQEYIVIPPGSRAFGVVQESEKSTPFEGGRLAVLLTEVELGGRLVYTKLGQEVTTTRVPLTFEDQLPPVVMYKGGNYPLLRLMITLPVLGFLAPWPEATIGRDSEITALADWPIGDYTYPRVRKPPSEPRIPRKMKWNAFKRSLLPIPPINFFGLWKFDWWGHYPGGGQDWSGIHGGRNYAWAIGLGSIVAITAQIEREHFGDKSFALDKKLIKNGVMPDDPEYQEVRNIQKNREDWTKTRDVFIAYTVGVYLLNLADAAIYGGEPKSSEQQKREPGMGAPQLSADHSSISISLRW
jgi:hypothetical protein